MVLVPLFPSVHPGMRASWLSYCLWFQYVLALRGDGAYSALPSTLVPLCIPQLTTSGFPHQGHLAIRPDANFSGVNVEIYQRLGTVQQGHDFSLEDGRVPSQRHTYVPLPFLRKLYPTPGISSDLNLSVNQKYMFWEAITLLHPFLQGGDTYRRIPSKGSSRNGILLCFFLVIRCLCSTV